MNRITRRFEELQRRARKGFIAYIGAGDPDLKATHDLAIALDRVGVDILELGVPFSDPLADGLVNQQAAQRGLASGTTPPKVLETVAEIRRRSEIPIVLYVYYNLLYRAGIERFLRMASESGVDGILALDLPPEEAREYEPVMRRHDLSLIFLVAPTTPEARIRMIAEHATGFLYYVSREGVTGMQKEVSGSIGEQTALIRRYTSLPIAVGFGISTPEQASTVAAYADAVVVGSAIVNRIAQCGAGSDLVPSVASFVERLLAPLKADAAGADPSRQGFS